MNFHIKDNKKFKKIAITNKKPWETYKVSQKLNFGGRDYRQITYYKSILGMKSKEINGICFITDDGITITNKQIIKSIVDLGYRSELFFDDKSLKAYENFIDSDKKIKEKKDEYNLMIPALELFRNEGVEGCDEVINILNKIPEYKVENRDILKKYINKIKSYGSTEEIIFTEEMIKDVKPYYYEVMLQNFRLIKLFNSGRNSYENIRKKLVSEKKNVIGSISSPGLKRMTLRLETFVDYACNLLTLYDKVIDLDEKGYTKYFLNIENEKINDRILLVRSNK